jgi:hypothetical protein
MNPFTWRLEHRIALALAFVVGAALGVVLGYLLYASARGADGALSFHYWLKHPLRFAGLWWGLFGGVVGAAIIYIKRLSSV